MLPEHRQNLDHHDRIKREKEYVVPDVDDQEKIKWEQLVQYSLKSSCEISIVYLDNKRYIKITGTVICFNEHLNCLRVCSANGITVVPIEKIVAVAETGINPLPE